MDPSSDDKQIWLLLRERSLQPGGFGEDRSRIWPALLGAQPLSDPPPYSEVDSTNEYGNPMEDGTDDSVTNHPHADERQIKLDTDRSFVLYPEDSDAASARDALQSDLHGLLVSLFRKRRSLHYFQGFHDIMTVLFLTLPRPLHLACAEKMALHRVRDAMGVGLEPVLGLLRVLRNLLRLADPEYARLLESTSPLPYHALSHLLTLFSHDVPTLPLIQHVWDFLLSREPLAVVWLAAALILHRKPSVYLLADQDEEGMIHSVLGGMPELVDAEPDEFHHAGNDDLALDTDLAAEGGVAFGRPTPTFYSHDGRSDSREEQPRTEGTDGALVSQTMDEQTRASHDATLENEDTSDQRGVLSHVAWSSEMNYIIPADRSNLSTRASPIAKAINHNSTSALHGLTLELAASIPLPDSRPVSPEPPSSTLSTVSLPREAGSADHHDSLASNHSPSRSRSASFDSTRPSSPVPSPPIVNKPTPDRGKSTASKTRNKAPPLSLTRLLRQADDLLNTYPPSHPSLHVSEIMGPDSVMRTWRPLPISTQGKDVIPEKKLYNETDDYLETLVDSCHIVIPSPPPSPLLGPRVLAKKTRASPRTLGKSLFDPRRIGFRLGALTPAERRVLFMGALLVVGAAVALKSNKITVEGIVKASGGDSLKRMWNGKWTFISSVVAAWGRGLP